MNKILITVISYSNEEEVLRYAQMLSEQSVSNKISLVIVYNKKSDEPKINLDSETKKINLSIEIYDPKENLGYLNGCFYGYRQYIQKYEFIPEWLIVSNTDIDIPDKYFFEKFLNKNYDKDVWCIAPSVYSPNNKSYDNPQCMTRTSLRKLNRMIWMFERPIFALAQSELAKLKAKLKRQTKQSSQYVYSAHGCFFALRKEFIEEVKNLNYGGFLFSEEAYIAENIRLNKKKCFYDDSLDVIHYENSVTGLLSIKDRSRVIVKSLKYIREKFYGN